jgi:hypothetical protein
VNIRIRFVAALVAALPAAAGSIAWAGNVTVVAHHGTAYVIGDNTANNLSLQTLHSGAITVVGAPGTTVNGNSSAAIGGTIWNWHFDLGGGGDLLTLLDVEFPSPVNLTANLGAGEDDLLIESVSGISRLQVTDGPAVDAVHDRVVIKNCELSGDLVIACGAGNDSVAVSAGARMIEIATGHGDDGAALIGCAADLGVLLDLGAGNDLVFAGGLLGQLLDINGGPHQGTKRELIFDPLSGDVLVDMDFIVFPSTFDLQASGYGFEHEYDLLGDILDTPLEDAIVELAEERGLEP